MRFMRKPLTGAFILLILCIPVKFRMNSVFWILDSEYLSSYATRIFLFNSDFTQWVYLYCDATYNIMYLSSMYCFRVVYFG